MTEIGVYVYPEYSGPVHPRMNGRPPIYKRLDSIYENTAGALVPVRRLSFEEGTILLEGPIELARSTDWITQCHWCEVKYELYHMLFIHDPDFDKWSVQCPQCYNKITEVHE